MKRMIEMLGVLVASVVCASAGTVSTVSSHATPELVSEINTALANPVMNSLELTNALNATTLTMMGGETNGSTIKLGADNGDDAGDRASIGIDTSDNIVFSTDADSKGTYATKMTLGKTGILTLKGGATVDNTTSAAEVKITEDTVDVVGSLQDDDVQVVVGNHTTTRLALDVGACTNGQVVSFASWFTAAPKVFVEYNVAETTATTAYAASVTTNGFTAVGQATKGLNWFAIGTR